MGAIDIQTPSVDVATTASGKTIPGLERDVADSWPKRHRSCPLVKIPMFSYGANIDLLIPSGSFRGKAPCLWKHLETVEWSKNMCKLFNGQQQIPEFQPMCVMLLEQKDHGILLTPHSRPVHLWPELSGAGTCSIFSMFLCGVNGIHIPNVWTSHVPSFSFMSPFQFPILAIAMGYHPFSNKPLRRYASLGKSHCIPRILWSRSTPHFQSHIRWRFHFFPSRSLSNPVEFLSMLTMFFEYCFTVSDPHNWDVFCLSDIFRQFNLTQVLTDILTFHPTFNLTFCLSDWDLWHFIIHSIF